jgi:hypothetical protein
MTFGKGPWPSQGPGIRLSLIDSQCPDCCIPTYRLHHRLSGRVRMLSHCHGLMFQIRMSFQNECTLTDLLRHKPSCIAVVPWSNCHRQRRSRGALTRKELQALHKHLVDQSCTILPELAPPLCSSAYRRVPAPAFPTQPCDLLCMPDPPIAHLGDGQLVLAEIQAAG